MKKLTLLLILLIGSLSYGQTIIYSNAPDRQKIAFDSITGDISLQNSPPINISSKENRANKTTDLSSPNNTTYPTTQAVANAIAEVEVGSGITSQYMDSDKTLEQLDFGKYIYTDASIELTIDNSPAVSSKIGLKPTDIGKVITVKPSGVDFIGDGQDISQGFTVDSLNLATVFKLASNLYAIDGVYKPYIPLYGPELYTVANALGFLNNSDATTGLDDISGTNQASVENTSPAITSYAWEITSTAVSETSRGREILSVDDPGGTYIVQFWARQSSGTDISGCRFRIQKTTNASVITKIPTDWTFFDLEITVTDTDPQIEFFTNRSNVATAVGSIGDAIQVTDFTLRKKL